GARILEPPIDPEVSTTITSTLPALEAAPGPAAKPPVELAPEAVIVTTALTSLAPSGRYSFWKHSRWKSAMVVRLALIALGLNRRLGLNRLNRPGRGFARRLGGGGSRRHLRPGGRSEGLDGDRDVVVAPRFERGVHQAPCRV